MIEAPVWIAVNGARGIMLSCSPEARDALALGHLLGEGWISEGDDVLSLTLADGPGGAFGVEINLDADRADAVRALRRHCVEHGCGLRHVLDCEQPRLGMTHSRAELSDAASLFRALFAAADDASPDGGVHAAALSDGDTLVHVSVDVARHCAADRAIGLGLVGGVHFDAYGLVLTSRISGAIALKAVNTGLGWVASRSVATPLARQIAGAYGVQLFERAARRAS